MIIQAIVDREKGLFISIARSSTGPFEVRAWGPDCFYGDVLELDDRGANFDTLDQARTYAEQRYNIRSERWRESDVIGSSTTHRGIFQQLYPDGFTFNELCAVGWMGYEYDFLDEQGFPIPLFRGEDGRVYLVTYRTVAEHMEFLDERDVLFESLKIHQSVNYYGLFCFVDSISRDVEASEEFKRLLAQFIAAAKVTKYWTRSGAFAYAVIIKT